MFEDPEVSVADLSEFYRIEKKPHSYLMFVATIDGIVSSLEAGHETGYEVALRQVKDNKLTAGGIADKRALEYGYATADAIIGGSRTLAAKPGMTWHPRDLDLQKLLRERRRRPVKAVVTGTGNLDLKEPIFSPKNEEWQPVIFTTQKGKEKLEGQAGDLGARGKQVLDSTRIYSSGELKVDLSRSVEILRNEYNAELFDVQGGPTLAGKMIKEKLIDEIRLTISPQVMGNVNFEGKLRPNFVSGVGFGIDESPLAELDALGLSVNHIFLRYSLQYRHR